MKGQTRQELIREATKAGFIPNRSPGEPVWFSDIILNQNILLYLATIQN